MNYINNNGINYEYHYPYTASNGTCQSADSGVFNILGYTDLPSRNLYEFIKALHTQPVPIAFKVVSSFYSYSSGIIDSNNMCPPATYDGTGTNHAVLAVGYYLNPDDETGYVLLKNSWGTGWGESGYFRMSLNNNLLGTDNYGPCNMF